MTVSMQLGVGTGALGGGHQKTLRRSFSSSSSGARRLFLSPTIASLVSPRSSAPAAAVSVGLVALIKKEPARSLAVSDALGRTCDSVYEACLDACSLLLNATSEAPAVRAALGVMSEVPFLNISFSAKFPYVDLYLLLVCLPLASDCGRNVGFTQAVRHCYFGALQVHGMSESSCLVCSSSMLYYFHFLHRNAGSHVACPGALLDRHRRGLCRGGGGRCLTVRHAASSPRS